MRFDLKAGIHHGYRWTATGAIEAVKTVEFKTDSGADVTHPVYVPGQGTQLYGLATNGTWGPAKNGGRGYYLPVKLVLAEPLLVVPLPLIGGPDPDPPPPPPPPPPPDPTPDGVIARAGDNLWSRFLESLDVQKPLILDADFTLPSTWNYGGPNGHRSRVRIFGQGHTVQGTSLQTRFVYLGAASSTLDGVALTGFMTPDSGTIGIGPGCENTLISKLDATGDGVYRKNSHCIYVFGGGLTFIELTKIRAYGGAAIQLYGSGNPRVEVVDSELNSRYSTLKAYLGSIRLTRVGFRGPKPPISGITLLDIEGSDVTVEDSWTDSGAGVQPGSTVGTLERR